MIIQLDMIQYIKQSWFKSVFWDGPNFYHRKFYLILKTNQFEWTPPVLPWITTWKYSARIIREYYCTGANCCRFYNPYQLHTRSRSTNREFNEVISKRMTLCLGLLNTNVRTESSQWRGWTECIKLGSGNK